MNGSNTHAHLRADIELDEVVVHLGNTKRLTVGASAHRVHPEPREIFEAGLVACAALTVQGAVRDLSPGATSSIVGRLAPCPDGCSELTLEVLVPAGVRTLHQDELRRRIINACAQYAPAECGLHVDVAFAEPAQVRRSPVIVAGRSLR